MTTKGDVHPRPEMTHQIAPAGPRAAWVTAAWAALPLVAAFLVYLNALGGDFVYDDNEQIVNNPWVHDLRHLPDVLLRPVWAYKTVRPTNYYRPVQMGLYNLLWVAFGRNPFPFHLVNVLFHLLSVALLFLLVRKLSGEVPVAAAAALLFAIHPLNTEAVTWIACLPELTYASLLLAALLFHVLSWPAGRRRRLLLRGLAVFCFLLALLSKETAIVLILLIIPLEIWIRPRPEAPSEPAARRGEAGGGDGRGRFISAPWRETARGLVPYAVAALAYLGARLAAVGGLAPRSRADVTLLDIVTQGPVLLISYVRAMFLPTKLLAYHVLDRLPSLLHPLFLGSALGVILLAAIVHRLSRRRPDLAFAGMLALLPLLPVLYIPALGDNAFAERYAYLPTAGAAWIVAGAVGAGARRLPGARGYPAGLAAFALLLALPCAFRTLARIAEWRDDERLATATLRDEPRAWHMHVLLAAWYHGHGRLEEALATLEKGAAAFPENTILQAAVIDARAQSHRISQEEALRQLRPIAERHAGLYEVQYNFGVACLRTQQPVEAEAAFRRAIASNPHGTEAREGLFMALVAQGKSPEREGAQEGASPAFRSTDKLMGGFAALKAGRLEEARTSLEEALRLDPASDRAMLALALVADKRGEDRKAMDYCRRALALKPDSEPAHEQLGASALKAGEIQEAITALEKAVSLDPRGKQALNLLGVAYAQAGRPDDARSAFGKALAVDPDFRSARTNLEALERRLKGPGG